MKTSDSKEKYKVHDLSDKAPCTLCGENEIYSGIVLKGHFVCEDCVEYVSSGRVTDDGKIVFPDEKTPAGKKHSAGKRHKK